MGQRTRILTEMLGFNGWKVEEACFEDPQGTRFEPLDGYGVLPGKQLALEAASMPVMHVAVLHGLDWHTVRRAEGAALARWDATRPEVPLRHVGVDEKWLGRRHRLDHEFVTIVSNLGTGEPLWIGPHRRTEALRSWLVTLLPEQKSNIGLFAMVIHRRFLNAVRNDSQLKHAAVVHDPFHIMKRATEAVRGPQRGVLSCRA